jgi:hypothetical protein
MNMFQVYEIPEDLPSELWMTVEKLNFLLKTLYNKGYKTEVNTHELRYYDGKEYPEQYLEVFIYKDIKK